MEDAFINTARKIYEKIDTGVFDVSNEVSMQVWVLHVANVCATTCVALPSMSTTSATVVKINILPSLSHAVAMHLCSSGSTTCMNQRVVCFCSHMESRLGMAEAVGQAKQ